MCIRDRAGAPAPLYSGRVHRFDGHMIECDGFPATIGTLCSVATQEGGEIIAEIIGFQNNNNLLCVHETGARISVGAEVRIKDDGYLMAIGDGVLGRVFDSLGNCLDGSAPPVLEESWPLEGVKLNPLMRKPGFRISGFNFTPSNGQLSSSTGLSLIHI